MKASNYSNMALEFIKNQMDSTKFDYTATIKKINSAIFGKVTQLPNQDEKVFPKYINVSQYFDESYVGKISGVWFNLPDPSLYAVEIYILTDTYYLQDTCQLKDDGTWQTSKNIGKGIKEIRLVKLSNSQKENTFVEYPYSKYKYFSIRLYSLTDTEYLIEELPIFDVGAQNYIFYTSKEIHGLPVIKVMHQIWKNGNFEYEVVGVSGFKTNITNGRLPSSYLIPSNDPSYDKDGSKALGLNGYMLNSRSWLYDIGLTLLTFTASGDVELAEEIMGRLKYEQNEDGSFNFSYDNYIGALFDGYVRTGSVGWILWGMSNFSLKTNNHKYDSMIEATAEWLLSKIVTDKNDVRFGLLRGGHGQYDANYNYSGVNINWCSTEHQVSSLQGLYGAYLVTHDSRYKNAIRTIHASLISTLFDKKHNRFYQGVDGDGIDKSWALDCVTWAGLSTLNNKNFGVFSKELTSSASEFFVGSTSIQVSDEDEHYNTTYSSADSISGYKPYSDREGGYSGAPSIVWSEGTLGYIAFCLKQGREQEANELLNEIIKMQDVPNGTGGVLYTTGTYSELPWEFHVWECVTSSAWLYLINHALDSLFPTIPFLQDNETNDFQLLSAAENVLSSIPITKGIKANVQWKNNSLSGNVGPFYVKVEVSESVEVDVSHHYKIPIKGAEVDLNDLVDSLDNLSQKIRFDQLVQLYGSLNSIAKSISGQSSGDSEERKNEIYVGIAPAIPESAGRYGTSIVTKSSYSKRVEKNDTVEQAQTNIAIKINFYFTGDPLAQLQVSEQEFIQSQNAMQKIWNAAVWSETEVAQLLMSTVGMMQNSVESLQVTDGNISGTTVALSASAALLIILVFVVII